MTASTEKRVIPLELFFDLVFVFALTQVTALMSDDPTWRGLGRGRLTAALVSVALIPLAVEVDALGALAIAAAVSSALIAYEVIRFAEPRARVRSGAD